MSRKPLFSLSFSVYATLVLATFGGLLTADTPIWGVLLIGWAFFALFLIHKIMLSNTNQENNIFQHKPVARLLAGVVKKSRDKELMMREAGTRMSVGMLSMGGMLLSIEIFMNSGGYGLYRDISFICLCGLMFWITQAIIRHQRMAYFAMALFSGLSLFFISQIWEAITTFTERDDTYGIYMGGYLLIGVTAFVFIRAVCIRHRYQEFAITGLVASGLLFCVLALGEAEHYYPLLFLLWGIVCVAWTQSRPQSKIRYALLYSKKSFSAYSS